MSFWSWIGIADNKDVLELKQQMNRLIEENRQLVEANKELLDCIAHSKEDGIKQIGYLIESSQGSILDKLCRTNKEIGSIAIDVNNIHKEAADIKKENDDQNKELIRQISFGREELAKAVDRINDHTSNEYENIKNRSIDNLNVLKEKIELCNRCISESSNNVLNEIRDHEKVSEEWKLKLSKEHDEIGQTISRTKDISDIINNKLSRVEDCCSVIKNKTGMMDEIHSNIELSNDSINKLWTIMKVIWVDSVLSDLDSIKQDDYGKEK